MRRLLGVALLVSTWAGSAGAVQLGGRTGLGYAQAIGGPDGLAVSFGAGNLIIEGILGFQYESFADSARAAEAAFDLGLAGHFQLLRAEWAALTLGARINLLTGTYDDGAGSPVDVLQWGVDLPLRVYWFPLPNVALHSELGLAIQPGPADGVLTSGLTPDGLRLNLFNGGGLMGGLGLSFWWG